MDDRYVLNDFFSTTGGERYWNNVIGWNSDDPLSNWNGVVVNDDGHVIDLDQSGNNLSGNIPDSIGKLSSLNSLLLYENKLFSYIPESIGHLMNLQVLRLERNNLHGIIPECLSLLVNLTQLNLSDNQISGHLPSSLGHLSNLTSLSLSRNQLTGGLPVELSQMSKLTMLSLDANQLSGNIPESLGQLTKLTHLRMNKNQLTGVIPESLGQLSHLSKLWLHDNLLSGAIPESIGQLTQLTTLDLHHNQLTGYIPISIGQLTNLTQLYLQENLLSGIIPTTIGSLIQVTDFYIFDNQLSGSLPESLCQLVSVTHLRMSNNHFTGSIPKNLGQLSHLTVLDLSHNHLSGSIPDTIGQLSELTVLYLHENQLSGVIPVSIGNLKQLTKVFLYDNQLTGTIPETIGQVSHLAQLDLHKNQLTGLLPDNLKHLKYLRVLSLQNNLLSGEIPDWGDALSGLTKLNLDHNRFTGLVPKSFGQLYLLNELTLSGNDFDGGYEEEICSLSIKEQLYWWGLKEIDCKAVLLAAQKGHYATLRFMIKDSGSSGGGLLKKYTLDTGGEITPLHLLAVMKPIQATELFANWPMEKSHKSMSIKVIEKSVKFIIVSEEEKLEVPWNSGSYQFAGTDSRIMPSTASGDENSREGRITYGFWFSQFNYIENRHNHYYYYITTRIWSYFISPLLWLYTCVKQCISSICCCISGTQMPHVISLNLSDIRESSHLQDSSSLQYSSPTNVSTVSTLSAVTLDTTHSKFPVTSYTLPCEYMSSIAYLKAFILMSDRSRNIELFDNENIRVAILKAWLDYGRIYHIGQCILYITYLALITYSNYASREEETMVVDIAILVLNTLLSCVEIAQLYGEGLREYLSDNQNWLDISSCLLVYIGVIIRLVESGDSELSREVMAVASILVWIGALNLLRPFSFTGSLVRMVFAVVIEIIPFLIILALVLFGFSQSFYLLTYDDNDDIDFESISVAYLNAFSYMMGGTNYNLTAGINSKMFISIMVLFVTFAQILLLNLLIAYLTDIYSRIQSHAIAEAYRERCRIIAYQVRFWHVYTPKYIHFLKKNTDVMISEYEEQEKINSNSQIKADLLYDLSLFKQEMEMKLATASLHWKSLDTKFEEVEVKLHKMKSDLDNKLDTIIKAVK